MQLYFASWNPVIQSCLLILDWKYYLWSLQASFVSPAVKIVMNKYPKALPHLAF